MCAHTRRFVLTGFGVLSVAGEQSRCPPQISFFPKGGEDRNVPHAWGKTAQMAAGNYRDDTLFNTVLTSSNNLPGIVAQAVPMLHIQPVHPLLVVGSTGLSSSCTGFGARSSDTTVHKAAAVAPKAAAGAAQDVAESARVTDADDMAAFESSSVEELQQDQQPSGKQQQANEQQQQEGTTPANAQQASSAAAGVAAAASPTNGTTASGGGVTASRQLLHDIGSSVSRVSDAVVAGEPQDESTWAATGRHLLAGEAVTTPALYRLQYSLNGTNSVDTGDVNMMSPVQRITLNGLRNYPDVSDVGEAMDSCTEPQQMHALEWLVVQSRRRGHTAHAAVLH